MQMLVPGYLEYAMRWFSSNQEQMRKYMTDAFGGLFPFGQLNEMGKQNMAMFERAMKMFSPFSFDAGGGAQPPERPAEAGFDTLRSQLEQLQKQLETLSKQTKPKE
jgi:polyhydroxyalkanoate synthesis regulator protein